MPLISSALLKKHLLALSRPRDPFENPETLNEIQDYIRKTFESSGYQIAADVFQWEGREFSNWIASPPGSDEIPALILGAHFDAVPGSPGADDNASGVAALLEIARAAAETGKRYPVHFIAFHMEEYGMAGSQAYVAKRKQSLQQAHRTGIFKGMLSLEMIGYTSRAKGSQKMPPILRPFYPDTGDFLALVGDGSSGNLLNGAKEAFCKTSLAVETLTVPMQGKIFPEVRLSDHSLFWDEGLPALLVTDTSFFRNPHYHLGSDTLETLDLPFLTSVAEGSLNLVLSHCK